MSVLRVKLKMEQILMNIVPLIVIGSKIRQKLKKKTIAKFAIIHIQ